MSEQQVSVQQVFKEYKVLTASSAEQIGLSTTAMLLLGVGWQLFGPAQCVTKSDGSLEYFQPIIHYEYVTTPVPQAEEAPASGVN